MMLSGVVLVLRIPTMPPLLFVRGSHSLGDGAADVWNKVTGENLASWWFWDTPSDLRDAIININGNVNHKVVE